MARCVRCGKKYSIWTATQLGVFKGHCDNCSFERLREREEAINEAVRSILQSNSAEKNIKGLNSSDQTTRENSIAFISAESSKDLESCGMQFSKEKRTMFFIKMSLGALAFFISLILVIYNRGYDVGKAATDIIFGYPIGLIMTILSPLLLIGLVLFMVHTLYKYVTPLKAKQTSEGTVKQFFNGVLANLFPNHPSAYVCLLSNAKKEFSNYGEFKEYWIRQKKIWDAVILHTIKVEGNIHVYEIDHLDIRAITDSHVRCIVNMRDNVRLQTYRDKGMVTTKSTGQYSFPLIVDLHRIGNKWYLAQGKFALSPH